MGSFCVHYHLIQSIAQRRLRSRQSRPINRSISDGVLKAFVAGNRRRR